MRIYLIFFVGIWFAQSGALSAYAQSDTIYYNKIATEGKGENIEVPFKSRVTGATEIDYLRTGPWQFLDSNDNVLIETTFSANKRKRTSTKEGLQLFRDPISGDTLLMQEYSKGVLVNQLGLKNAILVIENTVYHIYKDFGSFTIAEYRFKYSGSVGFASIWKSSIEDPRDVLNDTNYLRLEKERGDPSLLQPASYSTKAEYNYVSNPEFEKHPSAYFSIMSFTDQVAKWGVASVSPDLYLSKTGALSGNSFVGIRVFSLKKDIEYIQNKLRKPLIKDSTYCFSAYLKLSPGSMYATNAFGFLLSVEEEKINTDELLTIKPSKNLNTQVLNYKTRWMKVQCTYKAMGGEQYLTLGSFQNHKDLELIKVPGNTQESYYYIDDVSLVPVANEEQCACNFGDNRIKEALPDTDTVMLAEEEVGMFDTLRVGDTLVLDNIHFDNDKSDLLAESYETLAELLIFMHKYTTARIQVDGHTSSVGEYLHNIVLSRKRAAAVERFLTNNGIDENRIETNGLGPDYPIAENTTEAGQKENRRVEFKLLAL
jgi:outer membrane protein OmpA-like peptidoglycan-associated protein